MRKQPTGIAVDIVTEILKRNKIKTRHLVIPWKRCLRYLETGKVDIVPNSSWKKERTNFAYYTKPVYETHLVLFYAKSKFKTAPKISTIQDLKPYRIGGVLGFNYDHYNGVVSIDTSAKNRINLIKMLGAARIDFAILQKEVMMARQKKGEINFSDFGSIPDPLIPVKAFHILTVKNRKGKQLKAIIDDGIDGLKADGSLEMIHRKYLGDMP